MWFLTHCTAIFIIYPPHISVTKYLHVCFYNDSLAYKTLSYCIEVYLTLVCVDGPDGVLMLKSWHKGNDAPSIRSSVVDEERIRPGHWLGLVPCVPFSALTLLIR